MVNAEQRPRSPSKRAGNGNKEAMPANGASKLVITWLKVGRLRSKPRGSMGREIKTVEFE